MIRSVCKEANKKTDRLKHLIPKITKSENACQIDFFEEAKNEIYKEIKMNSLPRNYPVMIQKELRNTKCSITFGHPRRGECNKIFREVRYFHDCLNLRLSICKKTTKKTQQHFLFVFTTFVKFHKPASVF